MRSENQRLQQHDVKCAPTFVITLLTTAKRWQEPARPHVICPHDGILFSHKKGILTHATISVNHENITLSTSDTKGPVLYEATYVRYLE